MKTLLPSAVLLSSLAFAAAPFVATDFAGFDPNLFPVPQVDPPVQPAGWAFSIWGLIYLWLISAALFGLLRRAEDPVWHAMRVPLLLSLVPGIFWLSVASASPIWSTVLIWWMLGAALVALARTDQRDPWWLAAPLGLFAGWLTAASSVSLGLLAAGYGFASEIPAAIGALLIGLALALSMQRRVPHALSYPLAVIWALSGVASANLSPPSPFVLGLCGIGILALAFGLIRSRRRHARAG